MDIHKNTAPTNHLLEIKFQSNKGYQTPFFDIYLDVVFTDPMGRERIVPAFWSGENHWSVRYSSAIVGTHQFTSLCNDTSNKALHKMQGSIEVTAYAGSNELLRRGAPIVAANKRHFTYGDATPFFWLGDTWWLGLTKRLSWPSGFKKLAKDRQQKGFTVVQIVAGLYPDMAAFDARGESHAGFAWEKGFKTINPAFFDEADARILHLISLGISPCILGSWGYYLQWLGAEKMKLHWRYVMARWGALPVIWAAAGEQTMPWYLSKQKEADSALLKREWTTVIRYMREINTFNRMITTHPQTSARMSVEDPLLLDFEMQQTNHRAPTFLQAASATEGWHTAPTMPVVNGESRYEALEITPKVTTTDARQAFWAHMLNSGCAGHTYGVNGVWQVNLDNNAFGQSPNGHNWGSTSWNKAMQLPGSGQLSLAKKLLLSLPWHTLEAVLLKPEKWKKHYALISPFRRNQKPIAAAVSPNGELAIYYFLNLKHASIKLPNFTQPADAFWFDPTNGNTIPAKSSITSESESYKCKPPGLNADQKKDWVLVITKKD